MAIHLNNCTLAITLHRAREFVYWRDFSGVLGTTRLYSFTLLWLTLEFFSWN